MSTDCSSSPFLSLMLLASPPTRMKPKPRARPTRPQDFIYHSFLIQNDALASQARAQAQKCRRGRGERRLSFFVLLSDAPGRLTPNLNELPQRAPSTSPTHPLLHKNRHLPWPHRTPRAQCAPGSSPRSRRRNNRRRKEPQEEAEEAEDQEQRQRKTLMIPATSSLARRSTPSPPIPPRPSSRAALIR